MKGQLKPLFKKDLKHRPFHLLDAGVSGCRGLNVVMLGGEPGRVAEKLIILHAIGIQNEASQSEVRHSKPARNGLK